MFYLKLYPDETRAGEVVTYNGTGGVEAVDILYTFDDGDKNVVMYSGGEDQADGSAVLWMYINATNLTHRVMWQGDTTTGDDDPKLILAPITPEGQDGYCHVSFYAEAESASSTSEVLVDLDWGDSDFLRLQYNDVYQGVRRAGTEYKLDLQWKSDADVSNEHSVEVFRNTNTAYSTKFEDDEKVIAPLTALPDHMDIYGRASVIGWLSIGSIEAGFNYFMPPGKPNVGTSLPGGVSENKNFFPLMEDTMVGDDNPRLKWYSLEAGDDATIAYDSTKRTVTIDCDCAGSGDTTEVEVVNGVTLNTSTGQIDVTYTTIEVLSESSSSLGESIGEEVEVVIDNDVTSTFKLQHNKQTVYVLYAKTALGLAAGTYHTGTEC